MCTSIVSKKCTNYIFKIFITKNAYYHLSLHWVILILQVEGIILILMGTYLSGWWLLKLGVALEIS